MIATLPIEHPELIRWLESLPPDNGRLATLAEAAREASDQWQRWTDRGLAITTRIQQIDTGLIDAGDGKREKLTAERARLTAEVDARRSQEAVFQQRATSAAMAYFRHVQRLAESEMATARHAFQSPAGEAFALRKKLAYDDARTAGGRSLRDEERSDIYAKLNRLHAQMQEPSGRYDRAEQASRLAGLLIEQTAAITLAGRAHSRFAGPAGVVGG